MDDATCGAKRAFHFSDQSMRKTDVSFIVLIDTPAFDLQAADLVSGYSTASCQVQFSYFPFLEGEVQLLHPTLQVTFE